MERVALITGASRGFGFAVGTALARTHHIIALARTVGGLEDLDDEVRIRGGSATLVPLDAADENGIRRLCAAIFGRWGGVDLWVNTIVHAAPMAPAPHIDAKDWSKSVTVNLDIARLLIECVDPLLTLKNGTAVQVTDPRAGQKFFGAYGAAKAAQDALFGSWAAELENTDRRVLRFEPHPMPTATRARFFPGEDRAWLSPPEVEARRLVRMLGLMPCPRRETGPGTPTG
ncbi:MAG: SDR family oxidoreductase [Rhodobacteraceae bacterium]|nr:SDR family oxidoreductase [Paracoccaceae bacterium]